MPHWRRSHEEFNDVRGPYLYGRIGADLTGIAAELSLPKDGWASWQIAAVDARRTGAAGTNWDHGKATRKTCRLDEDRGNFGSYDHSTTDTARVYAHLTGGKIERLRVVSATCAVEAATPIQDLGTVDADASARLLVPLAKRNPDAGKKDDFQENALAGLALHRGEIAQNTLCGYRARRWRHRDSQEGGVLARAAARCRRCRNCEFLMFGDPQAELRKHAASRRRNPNRHGLPRT
jgi:hypothetical protein